MSNGDNGCVMESKGKFEKDGLVKCKVTKFEKMGDFPVTKEKGYEFSFKYKMDGKNLIVSDFEGDDVNDEARSTLGGEYAPAKS
jgi:hypothetical protein